MGKTRTRELQLLRERERKGLLLNVVLRLGVLGSLAAVTLFMHHSTAEIVMTGATCTLFAGLNAFILHRMLRGEILGAAGIVGLMTDLFIMIILPVIWYRSVGWYDAVPATYLLKTMLPLIALVLIALNTLAIRPLYPLTIALMFDLVWGFFFGLVLHDTRTVYTDSFVDNFFTPAIMPANYLSSALIVTVVGAMLSYLTWTYRRLLSDAVRFEVQTSQLGRYFSPGILAQIKDDESLFQARRAQVAVMFSDIRGFTTLSEKMDPERVVALLREYHARMVETIYRHGGTIDKFLGDGIMVTFGTPHSAADDCLRACRCALEMQHSLAEWNELRATRGQEPIAQGIGMHFGEVISGNIGSEDRLEYTVIGDTVNLASRIESRCRDTGESLLMSGEFAAKLEGGFELREVGVVTVKGRTEPVSLFRCLAARR